MRITRLSSLLVVVLFLLGLTANASSLIPSKGHASRVGYYGKLPLAFEVNRGQTSGEVKFLSRGGGYILFLTPAEAVLNLARSARENAPTAAPRQPAMLRMSLVGARSEAMLSGTHELPGKSNYFIGNDPRQWRTNLPTYAQVKRTGVYQGIDLVYYGTQGQLEYDFVIAPGSDPKQIGLQFDGAEPALGASGDLILTVEGGSVRFQKPVVYQTVGHSRNPVAGRYVLASESGVRFEIGNYDHNRTLVIDPLLVYSSYLGGTANDQALAVAVDAAGSAYLTGSTLSADFPPKNPIQTYQGNGLRDAFVTKMNPTGSALVYSTYLGGESEDFGNGIALDSSKNAYVAGQTRSNQFPVTPGALRQFCGEVFVNGLPTGTCNFNEADGFVTKLNSTGSALVYSTFLGGTSFDEARAIAVDGTGAAYVVGNTNGALPTNNPNDPGFPITPLTAFQNHYLGTFNTPFFVKLNPAGSNEIYGTLIGSPNPSAVGHSFGNGVAFDSAGNGYITGYTPASDFPVTPGAFQTTCQPLMGAQCNSMKTFVSKFDPTKSMAASLVYSTFLGGKTAADTEEAFAMAVDNTGSAYVTGWSTSPDFPVTAGAFQTVCQNNFGSCHFVFVTKFNPAGSGLVYSTMLGSNVVAHGASNSAEGFAITLDKKKNAYMTGHVAEAMPPGITFPVVNPLPATGDGNNVFVSEFNPKGTALLFSTELGGTNFDWGQGIAVDTKGSIYVAGYTISDNFPVTPGAFQTVFHGPCCGGGFDAFISKISTFAADLAVTNSAPGTVQSGSNLTFVIGLTNLGPDTATTVAINDTTPVGTTFQSVTTTAGTCTSPVVGGTGKVACKVPSLANAGTVTVNLTVRVTGAPGSKVKDTASATSKAFDPNKTNSSAKTTTTVN
jgi:uncharacterized repeat protein (TIGR01451 family)